MLGRARAARLGASRESEAVRHQRQLRLGRFPRVDSRHEAVEGGLGEAGDEACPRLLVDGFEHAEVEALDGALERDGGGVVLAPPAGAGERRLRGGVVEAEVVLFAVDPHSRLEPPRRRALHALVPGRAHRGEEKLELLHLSLLHRLGCGERRGGGGGGGNGGAAVLRARRGCATAGCRSR